MKIRNGFVSNSSSSSFIVAVEPGKTKIKLEIEVDLENFADGTFTNLNDYLKYQKYNDWPDLEDESHKKILEALSKGKAVLIGSFSDENEGIEEYLCDNGIPKETEGIDIIQSEGGY